MYAVVKTGGKQYKVAKDDVIRVEKLATEAGASIALDQVLMIGDDAKVTLGTPLIDGATVQAEVVEQTRSDKVIVFKKKRRKNYRRTYGHRQDLTVLRITDILADGELPATAPSEATVAPKDEAPTDEAPKDEPAAEPETTPSESEE